VWARARAPAPRCLIKCGARDFFSFSPSARRARIDVTRKKVK